MYYLLAFLALMLVILVHELGHFVLAKLTGVPVLSLSVGLGRALWSRQIGCTLYVLRTLPLGGFARMIDPMSEAGEPFPEDDSSRKRKFHRWFFPIEAQERVLYRKLNAGRSAWQRGRYVPASILVSLAGPGANVLLVPVIFSMLMYFVGLQTFDNSLTIGELPAGSSALAAGMHSGDMLVSVEGAKLRGWRDVAEALGNYKEQAAEWRVARFEGGHRSELKFSFGAVKGAKWERGQVSEFDPGFRRALVHHSLSVGEACQYSLNAAGWLIDRFFSNMAMLPEQFDAGRDMAGPVGVVRAMALHGENNGFQVFVEIVARISLAVAFLNLLPIPGLDGWGLVVALAHGVLGRPLSSDIREGFAKACMACLMVLAILLLIKDFWDLLPFRL